EQRLAYSEPQQQVTAVESDRMLQRLWRSFHHAALESRYIDLYSHRVHRNGLTIDTQRRGHEAGESLAKSGKPLAEHLTSPLVTRLAPQKSSQLVAPVGLAGSHSEVGQERLSLLRGQAYVAAGRKPRLETAEQRQHKGDHHRIADS